VPLHELEVVDDAQAAARRCAELIAARARGAVETHRSCTLALSGGRAPWEAFRLLADEAVEWSKVEIFQVDERIAPPGDDVRNLTHLRESLPAAALERLRPMPVESTDLETAAREYAALLPLRLDLVHLGLGPDGHTASLVPGDRVLDAHDRDVALTGGEYQGYRRMTLTYPVLDRARELVWLVTGAEKAEALRLLLAEDRSIPAGRVRNGRSVVVTDRAAAGR
jgi:6-phosphogluconolactonase